MSVKAYWLELVPGRFFFELRRFSFVDGCPGDVRYHNAHVRLEGERGLDDCPRLHDGDALTGDLWAHDDARWPAKCASCDYVFTPADDWQFSPVRLYRRSDTGELIALRDAPPGAIWNASWLSENPEYRGPDGRSLMGRCPDGRDWMMDSRASNCDSPCAECGVQYKDHPPYKGPGEGHAYRDARPHKCWVRNGDPPELTVNKGAAGQSCGAGAGSILTPGWHGFLTNGWFHTC
jgi:hypothetical protein